MQSDKADSEIDPKSMHSKSSCTKLHFYFLVGFLLKVALV